jgi:hypothetical protein
MPEPGDPMVALANSAPPNFAPPEDASPARSRRDFLRLPVKARRKALAANADDAIECDLDSSKAKCRLEDLVAGITEENRHPEVEPHIDALTLKAASIVLPVLRAKKVSAKMIRVMLENVLKVRNELHSKSIHPNFIEYLRRNPSGPNVFDRIRALHRRMAAQPKDETAKLTRAGRRLSAASKRELTKRGYSPTSIAAVEGRLAESAAEKTMYRGSFVKRRRRRRLLPAFKGLMSKKTVGNTQADLDAVKGDR